MNKKVSFNAAVITIVCSSLPCLGYASETSKSDSTVAIRAGFDHTSGTYGTKQTSSNTSVPVIFSYDTDNYQYALTVPYLEQTGPAGTIAGKRRRPATGINRIVTEKGLGDVTGSATRYLIDDDKTGISVDVKGEIKFATANQSKGLGTGKNDYSLQSDIYKDYEKLGLSGTLGYSVLGSPGKVVVNGVSENIIFHNVFYGSVGSTYKITEMTKVGLTYNMQQASEKGAYKQKDITADLNIKLSKTTKLQFYLLKGLANGSPDKGFGASIKASF